MNFVLENVYIRESEAGERISTDKYNKGMREREIGNKRARKKRNGTARDNQVQQESVMDRGGTECEKNERRAREGEHRVNEKKEVYRVKIERRNKNRKREWVYFPDLWMVNSISFCATRGCSFNRKK